MTFHFPIQKVINQACKGFECFKVQIRYKYVQKKVVKTLNECYVFKNSEFRKSNYPATYYY